MIRYWLTAAALPGAGGFDDIPLYHWAKTDLSNATITAAVSTSGTNSVSTNLIVGVDASVVPNTSSFSVYNARVLSFGSLPLTADKVSEVSANVKGSTDPAASIRVSINGIVQETQADVTGAFDVPVSALKKRDSVIVKANIDFKTVSLALLVEGALTIFYLPQALPFKLIALPVKNNIYLRKSADWSLEVRDSRDNGSKWYLYAQAPLPMSSATSRLPDDSLVFIENIMQSLSQPVLIYTGEGNTGEHTNTVINWNEIEGILLSMNPDQNYESGFYTTELFFTLSDKLL